MSLQALQGDEGSKGYRSMELRSSNFTIEFVLLFVLEVPLLCVGGVGTVKGTKDGVCGMLR